MDRDLAAEIVSARQGDSRALDSLFARNMAPLVACIRARARRAIAARESAVDIAHSGFREVPMDADKIVLEGEGAFRNWLFMQPARPPTRCWHATRRSPRRDNMPSPRRNSPASKWRPECCPWRNVTP